MFDFITVLGSIVDALMVEFAVSSEFFISNLFRAQAYLGPIYGSGCNSLIDVL